MRRRILQPWAGIVGATVAIIVIVASLRGLQQSFDANSEVIRTELTALEDAAELRTLFYQRGFTAKYFLTGDQRRLADLERAKAEFEMHLDRAAQRVPPQHVVALFKLRNEYRRWDATRNRAISDFESGARDEAIRTLAAGTARGARIKALIDQLLDTRKEEVEAKLTRAEETFQLSLAALSIVLLCLIAGTVLRLHSRTREEAKMTS